MVCTEVMPHSAAWAMAVRRVCSISSTVGSWRRAITMLAAVSRKMPVGSPFSSTSKWAPSGWGVSLVMPAISMARELAVTAWPQARSSTRGYSVVISSRSWRSIIRASSVK